MPSTLVRTEGAAAFKEWAVSCEALGLGHQAMIFRKGGIKEKGRSFTMDHPAFFLYPTYEHQDRESIKPQWHPLLDQALAAKPDLGTVTLKYWARVDEAWALDAMAPVLGQVDNHIYSEQSVRDRWEWQSSKPLWLLLLRVYRLQKPLELEVLEDYTGCRSWIDLDPSVVAEGLACEAVLDDAAYTLQASKVRALLV